MWNWKVIFEEWAERRTPLPPVSAPTGNGVTTAELFESIGEPGLSEETHEG